MKKSDLDIINCEIEFDDPNCEQKYWIQTRLYKKAKQQGLVKPGSMRDALTKSVNAFYAKEAAI